jgi:pimeloyl-ACP methyl ester carboxylesterase
MPSVDINRLSIAYDCFGSESGAPLLLISGLGVQMIRWTDRFCALLADRGFRVIRFDNRDAGLSTHLDDAPVPDLAALMGGRIGAVPYTLHDMADDAIGLLDRLGVDRAHVAGRSMGGMIAQILAARHPRRIASLTSIMSSTGNPSLPPPAPAAMAMLTRPAPDPRRHRDDYLAHAVALARAIGSPGFPFDEVAVRIQAARELDRAYNPAGFVRQIAAIAATGDLRPLATTISAPTLVIHGRDDPLIPADCGRDTAATIPGARLMLIAGMGHDLPPALYRQVADAVAAEAAGSVSR